MKEGVPQTKENNENNELYSRWVTILRELLKGEKMKITPLSTVSHFLSPNGTYNDSELDEFKRDGEHTFSLKDDEYERFTMLAEYAEHAAEKITRPDGQYPKVVDFIKEFMTAAESREIQERMEDVYRIKDEIKGRIVGSRGVRETPFADISEIKSELEKIIEDIEKLQQAHKEG